jgi:hypothetical protein
MRHATQASSLSPEEAGDDEVERACDTLFMCIVTTLNKGLRNGGGIGDVLRQPSSRVSRSLFCYFNCFDYLLGAAVFFSCYL